MAKKVDNTTPIVKVTQTGSEQVKQPISEAEARNFIYMKESTNRLDAINQSSGACGLGQSHPCEKLSNVCPNWKTDYQCQNAFFETYAKNRYGSWVGAYNFWLQHRWW